MNFLVPSVLLLGCILGILSSTLAAKSKAKPKAKAKAVPCPPFPYPELEHGSIIPEEGGIFRFRCDPGYFRASDELTRCYRGKWTSTKKPMCIRKQGLCDDPDPLPNGIIFGDERSVGSIVQYICNEGFVLLGEGRRTCLRSGYWSSITPSCMDEKEPLQTLAERLNSQFVTELGNHSSDSALVQSRMLDTASVRQGLELLILLDRSSSVDPEDFKIGKDFIKFLLREFGVKNGNNNRGTRAAVLAFGSKVDMVFNVNDSRITGPEAANEALDAVEPNGGGTAMEQALMDVITQIITPNLLRRNAKKALFLITDGEPNKGNLDITPEEMARSLKDGDFEIFTVGVGRDINRNLLGDLASEPLSSHVFILDKYSDLIGIMNVIKDRPTEAPPVSEDRCGYIKKPENYLKKWPWIAAIYITTSEDENEPQLGFCSGTLICSEWVITAASCFYSIRKENDATVVDMHINQVFVTLGERDLKKDDTHQMNFYVADVRIHPTFDPLNELKDNLALLKLNTPAPMGRFRPACLPSTGATVPLHFNFNINASIAGWGVPPTNANPRLISAGNVQFHMTPSPVSMVGHNSCRRMSNRESHIFCAGVGQCNGDLGSPVVGVDPSTGVHHLLGVLARKTYCAKYSNQYSDLKQYILWINAVTQNCHSKHWMA